MRSGSGTFDVLAEAHGGGDALVLAVVVAFLLEDVVVTGVVQVHLLLPLLLLVVSWRQLLGEGEHGKDNQEHGHSAQKEPTPPGGIWGKGGRGEGQESLSILEVMVTDLKDLLTKVLFTA